jgi:uncharacterized coiled-coil DUF342 family protein
MSEKRDAYVQKLKARIDEWNADMDKLTARADQADAEAKIECNKKLKELRSKINDVEDKIAALQQAGEDSWEEIMVGLEKTWDAFKESFTKAKSQFEKGYREGQKK